MINSCHVLLVRDMLTMDTIDVIEFVMICMICVDTAKRQISLAEIRRNCFVLCKTNRVHCFKRVVGITCVMQCVLPSHARKCMPCNDV